jgi:hypothetical protein
MATEQERGHDAFAARTGLVAKPGGGRIFQVPTLLCYFFFIYTKEGNNNRYSFIISRVIQ